MNLLQIYVICGSWRSSRKNGWSFIADNEKCGRLVTLESTSTREDLEKMMLEDYNISPNSADVELSYLPTGLIGNSLSPPIIVSNDRQVRNLVNYLRKEPTVRLFVTFRKRVTIDLNMEPEEFSVGDDKEEKNRYEDQDNLHGDEVGGEFEKKPAIVASKEKTSRLAVAGFKEKQDFVSKADL